jgi:dethiobiotin synthetase
MTAYFVTATGTDAGKTYVTAGIIRAARQLRHPASAIKPVMSGYDPAAAAASDAGILLAAMGKPVTPHSLAAISPWRYAAALSPDMAAAREARRINLPEILTFCRAAIQAAPGIMLIEGVGGAMVPLTASLTVRDWIAELRLPALLVAGTYLGTISHTLTTAEALRARGVSIFGVLLSESKTSPVPPAETAAAIQRFLPGTPVHIIPRDGNDILFQRLATVLHKGHKPIKPIGLI